MKLQNHPITEDTTDELPQMIAKDDIISEDDLINGLTNKKVLGEKGTYLLRHLVAQGGQSSIYEALWLEQKLQVCVKIFEEKFSEQAQNEQDTLSKLRHPNIIQLLDTAYTDAGNICLIIEFISGGSIADKMQNGYEAFSISEIITIIKQIASALEYLHNNRIVHCDIKPGNILVDKFRIVLSDFSVAKRISNDKTVSKEKNVNDNLTRSFGTLMYSSPEHINRALITEASDQYSLAVVAFELLTRKRLFDIDQNIPPKTDKISTNLPNPISQVIHKALSKNPDERYETIQEFSKFLTDSIQANILMLNEYSQGDSRSVPPPISSQMAWEEPQPIDLIYGEERSGCLKQIFGFSRFKHDNSTYTIGYDKAFQTEELGGLDVKQDVDKLEDIRSQLFHEIDRAFGIATHSLEGGSRTQNECFERLRDLKLKFFELSDEDKLQTFVEVQFQIQLLYGSINRERIIQSEEKNWRWIVPTIILVYITIVILVIFYGGKIWTEATILPIIGIPLSVLIWAGIGSLAAILYRFYTRKMGRLGNEIKWLIARPIIGIIMGTLAYLTILSGLFIFGGATGTSIDIQPARPQLIWLLAFLGGFSDRFFETIIDNVVGRFSNTQNNTVSRPEEISMVLPNK